MKRTAEFVTGLIGGVFGVVFSFIVMLWAGNQPITEDNGLFVTSIIVLVLQITTLTLSCLVNKLNNKIYGVISIVIGALTLLLSALIFFIPAILQFVSGGLAFRSLKGTIVKETI